MPANAVDLLQLYAGQTANTASLKRLLGVGFNFKGPWASEITYAVNDAVSFGGSSHASLQNGNLNHSPDSSPAFWSLIADYATLVEQNALLAPWVTEHAITSRAVFEAAAANMNRVDFAAPESCVLELTGTITDLDKAALNSAAATADFSFADALRRIAAGATTANATFGIEQIAEIAPGVTLPTVANPVLVWHGPVRPVQRSVIEHWSKLASIAATLEALLQAFDAFEIATPVDPAEKLPRPDQLPHSLSTRLTLTTGLAVWHKLNLDYEEESALRQLAANHAVAGPTLRAALTLMDTTIATGSVTVQVKEAGFVPRPKPGSLLPDKLLIGNGLMRFYGVMSRAEAKALVAGVSAPDANAVAELFSESQQAGLNGAEIVVRARLGSADSQTSNIDTKLS